MAGTGVRYSGADGSVSPIHVLYSEVLSVTSVMRKNSRWSSSSQMYNTRDSALATNLGLRRAGPSSGVTQREGSEEEELMSAFEVLKRDLRSLEGALVTSSVCNALKHNCPLPRHRKRTSYNITGTFLRYHPLSSGHWTDRFCCPVGSSLILRVRLALYERGFHRQCFDRTHLGNITLQVRSQ